MFPSPSKYLDLVLQVASYRNDRSKAETENALCNLVTVETGRGSFLLWNSKSKRAN
jgi:hypothetical protein